VLYPYKHVWRFIGYDGFLSFDIIALKQLAFSTWGNLQYGFSRPCFGRYYFIFHPMMRKIFLYKEVIVKKESQQADQTD
jgi:hypothetical protein